ncbi:Hsp20/alpha crystallin family protein [Fervidibacillus albus]|uniref:Hsp20/alpha crystallin family protein n=1 Tax=Fervidibacillus albus TaxID=2980026 RepID=A0A9E8RVU8_9BACI|nr:Hsp20/alpha crystallin family protein [Fervidibacillus albus]WAA11055.1 Hsp20/alpha crystallin family protein [Fervidibacillus albus]
MKRFNEKEFQDSLEKWLKHMVSDLPTMFRQVSSHENSNKNQSINEQVFETHDDVYIRIPIEDVEKLKNMKIYYSINKCFIHGLVPENRPYPIILPVTVKKKGGSAIYKDGILEIRLPKNTDWQYSEIAVDTYE